MIVHEWAFGRHHDSRRVVQGSVLRYDDEERFSLCLTSAPLDLPSLSGYVDTDALGVFHPETDATLESALNRINRAIFANADGLVIESPLKDRP